MDFSVLLVFAIVFLASMFMFKKRVNLPPTRFTIPYIGTVGLMAKLPGTRTHETFKEESKDMGPIYSFKIFNTMFVILNQFDLIHEAFVKNAEHCSSRLEAFRRMLNAKPGEEGIIFNEYGESWRELRRFTIQALRDFGVGKTSIEEKIITELDALTQVLRDTKGAPVDVSSQLHRVVANVIFGIVFGQRYEFDDPEFARLLYVTDQFINGEGLTNAKMFLPECLQKVSFLQGEEMRVKHRMSNEMRQHIYKQIDEHEATFDIDQIRDFIDIYLKCAKLGNENEKKFITKENMYSVIWDLFLAGSETTSSSLDWASLYMSEYPNIQKKCQDEIQTVFGSKVIVYADRNKLPYTNATLLEIQRLASIVPLGVPHATSQDITVGGYVIPKDTVVNGNLYAASLDTKYFNDPETFNPARFLDSKGNVIKNDALIPFSTGPRVCAGESLAKMELFVVFTNLLLRFNICRENPDIKPSMKCKINRTTSVPEPYKVRALIRS